MMIMMMTMRLLVCFAKDAENKIQIHESSRRKPFRNILCNKTI